ncbi:MAG: hypothetical protein K9I94_04165 [Bacteroidales bacterium]|nr:hypothetical protein [Bacteroidales bacterium]
MKLANKFHKYLLLTTATALCWVFVGSLVNFHQHQLFGKTLLYKLQPYLLPSKEHSKKDHFEAAPDNGFDHSAVSISPFALAEEHQYLIQLPVLAMERDHYYFSLNLDEACYLLQLRGPPALA